MDPILIIILAGVGIVAVPRLVKYGVAKSILAIDKKSSTNKIYKEQAEERKRRAGGKVSKIDQSLDRVQDLLFKNLCTKETEKIRVSEIGKYKHEEDVLLKGRLHIVDAEGKRTVQDIYLFQPRLYVGQNKIGPVLNSKGAMLDQYAYLCRREGSDDILAGYVPRREVFSGMRFDYVTNGKHSFLERNPKYKNDSKQDLQTMASIEQFFYIDLPKDSEGNIIPVDLNNPEELRDFQNYAKAHLQNLEKNGVFPEEYFMQEYAKAQVALVKYINDYEPVYVPSISKMENNTQESIKVVSARKTEASINDYYKRFDYYLSPEFGERYNCYDGKNPSAHHSHHHH